MNRRELLAGLIAMAGAAMVPWGKAQGKQVITSVDTGKKELTLDWVPPGTEPGDLLMRHPGTGQNSGTLAVYSADGKMLRGYVAVVDALRMGLV